MRLRPFIDQAAHCSVAAAILSLAVIVPNPLTLAAAGFCIGVVREVAELGNPVTLGKVGRAITKWDSPLDLTFWALGGALVGVLV